MGVSGSGKSTVGKALAHYLSIPFLDADDFHPPANVQKMASGQPLTDTDRQPWLQALHQAASALPNQKGVVACSALKSSYRTLLSDQLPCRWVYLAGSFDDILSRLSSRKHHFMPETLLQSQFEALEVPSDALNLPIHFSVEKQIETIMHAFSPRSFGLMGLGVMGTSLARNLARNGISLALFNREVPEIEEAIVTKRKEAFPELQSAAGFSDVAPFVEALESPKKIFLMVPAGDPTDQLIEALIPCLKPGDILMDGGNTYFRDTERRQAWLATYGIHFLGIGVSGGEKGALEGPSIMPSGPQEAFTLVEPYLTQIAAKDDQGNPCCTYLGPGAAGHFVKMVHNGIEYAEMQLLAEVYGFLSSCAGWDQEAIAQLIHSWEQTKAHSYVLEITTKILRFREEDGSYLLPLIVDEAGSKGTGGWTTQTAVELGVPTTILTAALQARFQSVYRENQANWQPSQARQRVDNVPTEALFHAYQVSRILNHHQGLSLIKAAETEYQWAIPFQDLTRIWTNGCIIRSKLMETLATSLDAYVLDIPELRSYVINHLPDLGQILHLGIQHHASLPCFMMAHQAGMQAFHAYPTANLLQAQRDFFGAHRYKRLDDPDKRSFHTTWEENNVSY